METAQKPLNDETATVGTMAAARGRLMRFLNPSHPAYQSLIEKGYAVVDCIAPEMADELYNGVWHDFEKLGTGVDRSKPSTWKPGWAQTTHGLVQNQSSGLWPSVCAARISTEQMWKELFGGTAVISSWDAFAFGLPEYQNYCAKNGHDKKVPKWSGWLHTDQAKGRPEFLRHIQGALALTDLGPAELRTQLAIPKDGESSQSLRDRFLKAFPPQPPAKKSFDAERAEWISHTPEEKEWLAENADAIAPTLKRGQILLWASGTPHASVAGPLPEHQKERNIRASIFVSCIPQALVSAPELIYRRDLLEKCLTSGHRVCEPGKRPNTFTQCVFSKTGQAFNKTLPDYDTSMALTNFKVYKGLKRGRDEAQIEAVAPSKVHRAMGRMCGGYDV